VSPSTATDRPLARPAFYALRPGGWRELVTLLHPPYTAWHLSYVAIGAAVAPQMHLNRLGWTLAAFFLGVGVCAHALDELHGRPLGTRLPTDLLIALAAVALAAAIAIGVFGAITVSATIVPLTLVGAFIVLAYNLELLGGRFHTDAWFALSWGAFPAAVGYWACSQRLRPELLLVAGACFALSLVQRRLSSPVRELRRRTVAVRGEQRLHDGSTVELSAVRLAAPMEAALKACSAALVLLAAAMVLARL
jgi:hypothetical protein